MAKTVELVVKAQKLIIEIPFLMLSIHIIRITVSPKRLNVKLRYPKKPKKVT